MQFIDTHIHLQDFQADFAPPVLTDRKMRRLVLVAAQGKDFAKIAALKDRYPKVITPAFGFHPWEADGEPDLEMLQMYLQKYPDALVGEIGVDELKKPVDDRQRILFSRQLEIAKAYGRPVIVHAAKAFMALTEFGAELKGIKYVHHGYVKNRELLGFINRTGGYIGLGALFLKQERAKELLALMPQDKILFETDAPYRVEALNYPALVQGNLTKLSEIAEVDKEEFSARLCHNAEDFIKCQKKQL